METTINLPNKFSDQSFDALIRSYREDLNVRKVEAYLYAVSSEQSIRNIAKNVKCDLESAYSAVELLMALNKVKQSSSGYTIVKSDWFYDNLAKVSDEDRRNAQKELMFALALNIKNSADLISDLTTVIPSDMDTLNWYFEKQIELERELSKRSKEGPKNVLFSVSIASTTDIINQELKND